MAPGLGLQAVAGVNQQHGDIGSRRCRHHIARILLVAGRVGDDEAALAGAEEAVGDIDGDALFALGRQAIDQQSEVDLFALGAEFPGFPLQRIELVIEQLLRLP